MTGFEPWSFGIGSDHAVNCATTTARVHTFILLRIVLVILHIMFLLKCCNDVF